MHKNKIIFIETVLENTSEIVSINQDFLKHYIFRGQSNFEWSLTTSLERLINNLHGKSIDRPQNSEIYEKEMLRNFIWKYPLYEKTFLPKQDDYIEWLSLMQHYGAPTRLLDFSKSLYVALFMCMSGYNYENSCIWAINQTYLYQHMANNYRKYNNLSGDRGCKTDIDIFAHSQANVAIRDCSFKYKKDVLLLYPNLCNERLSIQQGLFLMPTNISCSFEENLNCSIDSLCKDVEHIKVPIANIIKYSYDERFNDINGDIIFQFKIKIPHKLFYQLSNMLKQMNITAETIFPGIEGMAKSLSTIYLHSEEYIK